MAVGVGDIFIIAVVILMLFIEVCRRKELVAFLALFPVVFFARRPRITVSAGMAAFVVLIIIAFQTVFAEILCW